MSDKLIQAVLENNFAKVKALLVQNDDINYLPSYDSSPGLSALHVAVHESNVEMLLFLIQNPYQSVDINVAYNNYYAQSPLYQLCASYYKKSLLIDVEILLLLLSSEADLDFVMMNPIESSLIDIVVDIPQKIVAEKFLAESILRSKFEYATTLIGKKELSFTPDLLKEYLMTVNRLKKEKRYFTEEDIQSINRTLNLLKQGGFIRSDFPPIEKIISEVNTQSQDRSRIKEENEALRAKNAEQENTIISQKKEINALQEKLRQYEKNDSLHLNEQKRNCLFY